MRISKSYVVLIVCSLIVISCSSDKNTASQDENNTQNIVVSGYTGSVKWDHLDPNTPDREYIYNGIVANGKLEKVTSEFFIDGISNDTITPIREYIYTDNNISALNFNFQDEERNIFIYDSDENLVGINWIRPGIDKYYRYVHNSETESYFERVSLQYDDPQAEIIYRKILYFDENENVVKAGEDSNLDGILDTENVFTYVNNNLVSAQLFNGESMTIEYSTIIDTHAYLTKNSFGKRVYAFMNADSYCGGSIDNLNAIKHSYHIPSQELQIAEYEVLDNNFYFKKTEITEEADPIPTTHSETIEFTFLQQ